MSGYIAEHLENIEGLIADEIHLFKGDSGQGDAMETLIGCSSKVIGMTATLINDYSSGLSVLILFLNFFGVTPYLFLKDTIKFEKSGNPQ